MQYHKINGVPLDECTAEQKIAYNLAFMYYDEEVKTMIIRVNETMFRDAFWEMGRGNQFSYEALGELFRYYDETDDATGEETEFDVIAICCEWCEHDTESMIANYSCLVEREEEWDDDDYSDAIAEYIRDNKSTVIELGGYSWLVMNF